MLNISLTRRFWKIFSVRWLLKILAVVRKLRSIDSNKTKGYYNNAISVRICLDGHGSKRRKVSRCRPTVSVETILATMKEFLLTKVDPVQSITDFVLLTFWLIRLPWMFILPYSTIYFFVNNFFSNVYTTVNTIFECFYLIFGWEISWRWGHRKCVKVRTGGGGFQNKCCGMFFVQWFGQVH